MEKLICIKCGGTAWTLGKSMVYTVLPAIHSQEYICSGCGYRHTVETREAMISNTPKEVFIDSVPETKDSKMESDISNLILKPGTTVSTDTTITFNKKK